MTVQFSGYSVSRLRSTSIPPPASQSIAWIAWIVHFPVWLEAWAGSKHQQIALGVVTVQPGASPAGWI